MQFQVHSHKSPTTELLLLYSADEEMVVQRKSLGQHMCGVMGSDRGGVKAMGLALAKRCP